MPRRKKNATAFPVIARGTPSPAATRPHRGSPRAGVPRAGRIIPGPGSGPLGAGDAPGGGPARASAVELFAPLSDPVSSMDELDEWTCGAPLNHPLRRAFVEAMAALYMEKVAPVPHPARWKEDTLRALASLTAMPGPALFLFCRAVLAAVQKMTGRQVLDPRYNAQDLLAAALHQVCGNLPDAIEAGEVFPMPKGRPPSACPEALVALVTEIRAAHEVATDGFRTRADHHVAEWAAAMTQGRAGTFLRAMRGHRARRGGNTPSR